MTAPVDISPEACERISALMLECGICGGNGVDPCGGDCRRCGGDSFAERKSAHMIRALRSALTAEAQQKEKLRAYVRRIAGTYTMDRDELSQQVESAKKLLEEIP